MGNVTGNWFRIACTPAQAESLFGLKYLGTIEYDGEVNCAVIREYKEKYRFPDEIKDDVEMLFTSDKDKYECIGE